MRAVLSCRVHHGLNYYQNHDSIIPSATISGAGGGSIFIYGGSIFNGGNMFRKIDEWVDQKVEALPKPTPLGFLLALVIFEVLLWIL
jgi:hypothetical protein